MQSPLLSSDSTTHNSQIAIPSSGSSKVVNFEAIAADIPRNKHMKSVRLEEHLLNTTEVLRERTNLNFSEYVGMALRHFNDCYSQYLSEEEERLKDSA